MAREAEVSGLENDLEERQQMLQLGNIRIGELEDAQSALEACVSVRQNLVNGWSLIMSSLNCISPDFLIGQMRDSAEKCMQLQTLIYGITGGGACVSIMN